jgi:hypothetical protein
MVSNAEAVGRLIANDTLLRGERQLLQKQDQPSQEPADEPAQRTAPPISYNDKAMSSVLLTLLDEQLDASIAANGNQAAHPEAGPSHSAEAASSNRIVAQYAEDDLTFRPDLSTPAMATPLSPSSQQIAQAASSPELQTFMQRFLISAAGRLQTDDAEGLPAGGLRRNVGAFMDSVSTTQVAGAALAVALLSIIIAASLAG